MTVARWFRSMPPRRKSASGTATHWLACWAALAFVVAAPALGQSDRFEDRTDVLEVQVPVNVLTKDGSPLRGLTLADFDVRAGGKKQEIAALDIVDLEILGPEVTAANAEEMIPAAARRHVLLLFDLAFSDLTSVVRARHAAREFVLNALHPSDLVAVATHSVELGSRLLITFTPDRAQLARAIDTLGAPRLLDRPARDPLNFLLVEPSAAGVTLDSPLGTGGARAALETGVTAHLRVIAKEIEKSEKSYARGRVFSWARSMGELARTLDSVVGRKHVVYFSEGFDGRLLLGRNPDFDDEALQDDLLNLSLGNHWAVDMDDLYGNTALQTDFAKMLGGFQRSDCVIQAVNISGLRAERLADRRGRDVGEDALFYIANETGGNFYHEANDLSGQLSGVLESSSLTYLLTLRPKNVEADGKFHRIKVAVNVPDAAKVVYRPGFYAPRPFEELHPLEKSLLASDAIAAADQRREVDLNLLVAPFKASPDRAYVPVIVEMGGDSLLEDHKGKNLPVEIYAYATDATGRMMDFFAQMITLDVSKNTKAFRQGGLKYYGHLELPVGDFLVRVLVRNATSGRTGVETATLGIPKFGEGEPLLLPPFFPESSSSWHLARERAAQYESSTVYPFVVNGSPYIPAAQPDLASGSPAQVYLVAYNMGAGTLAVDGRLLSEDGERVVEAVDISQVERTTTGIEGLDKLMALFDPAGLEAGTYKFEVNLRDVETGQVHTNSTPITIRN